MKKVMGVATTAILKYIADCGFWVMAYGILWGGEGGKCRLPNLCGLYQPFSIRDAGVSQGNKSELELSFNSVVEVKSEQCPHRLSFQWLIKPCVLRTPQMADKAIDALSSPDHLI